MPSPWPKLPRVMQGVGGPITVRTIKRVRGDDGVIAYGTWDAGARIIRIEQGSKPAHRWRVLFHEWTHAVLDDSGVANQLSEAGNETLCDAMATARIIEMRDQLGITA